MSIRALRYLIALATYLNFTRAAEHCCVTQSTLSIQLRKLEDYLGVKLFERDRCHVVLTKEGAEVLRFARVAVRAADRIVLLGRRRQTLRRAIAEEGAAAPELLIDEINCPVRRSR